MLLPLPNEAPCGDCGEWRACYWETATVCLGFLSSPWHLYRQLAGGLVRVRWVPDLYHQNGVMGVNNALGNPSVVAVVFETGSW